MNSNVLEFYVTMKDLMSKGLHALAKTSQSVFAQIKSISKSASLSVENSLVKALTNSKKVTEQTIPVTTKY